MYRISVTTIEKFRRVMTGASSFDTEAALIQSLKGEFTGNAKTRFGNAYEKIVENPTACLVPGGYRADGYFFSEDQASPAVRFHLEHPQMVYQIPAQKVYDIQGYSIQVSGKFDGAEGILAHDFKCKFRAIDWQEYYDSYQWRFYLDMLGLKVFNYDVFEVRGTDDEVTGSITDFIVEECSSTYFMAYPEMRDDCHSLLYRFMEYIKERDLFHLLKKAHPITQ